jgi:hypothetical protein
LQNKDVFARSPAVQGERLNEIFAWDNFTRPDENPITVSDSGHSYVNLVGTGFRIVDNQIRPSLNLSITGVSTGFGSVGIYLKRKNDLLSGDQPSLVIGKNSNNYFSIELRGTLATYRILAVIGGVTNVLFTVPLSTLLGVNLHRALSESIFDIEMNYYHKDPVFSESCLCVRSRKIPQLNIDVDVTSYNSTFVNSADVSFAGFSGRVARNNIYSMKIYRLR